MADTDDTRVRLSAEGLAEVLSALRQMKAEAQATAKAAGRDFGGFNTILEQGKRLLGQFGIAATAAGLAAFVVQSANAADNMQDLSESTGLATDELQTLLAAGEQAGVGVEKMTGALTVFQKKLDDLASGDAKTKQLFKRLGLTPEDFKGKELGESLDLIVGKLGNLAASEAKTAVVSDLFGAKVGSKLIPAFNQLAGQGGLEGATKRAKLFGRVLEEDVVQAAAGVADEITSLQRQAGNLGIIFVSELAPAAHDAFTNIGEGIGVAGIQMREFSEALGPLSGPIGSFFNGLEKAGVRAFDHLATLLVNFSDIFVTVFGPIQLALAERNLGKAVDLWEAAVKRIRSRSEDLIIRDLGESSDRTSLGHGLKDSVFGAPKDIGTGADLDKSARERQALLRALADNELKRTQTLIKAQQDLEKRRFEDGLTNLNDYYSRRGVLIETAAAAEIATLQKRIDAEQSNPDAAQRQLNVTNLRAQIEQRSLELEIERTTLVAEQETARKKLEEERVASQDSLLEVEGRRHEQAMADIKKEVDAFRIVLGQTPGLSDDQRRSQLNQFEFKLSAGAEFRKQDAVLTQQLAELDRERAEVQVQVESSTISELDGKEQIVGLELARLPVLREIAQLELQAAIDTGDSEKVAHAQALIQALDGIGIAASQSKVQILNFRQAAGETVGEGLTSFLDAGARGFENLGDAALSAISSILQGINHLAAQIISSRILELLKLAFSPTSSIPFGSPPFARKAQGGLVRGPGTETSDSIHALLSDGEYVVRAAAVRRPGVLQLLRSINDTQSPVSPRALSVRGAGFASGGLVGAGSGGSSTVGGTIGVSLDEGLLESFIESPRGQRVLLKTMSRRHRAFNRSLGRN